MPRKVSITKKIKHRLYVHEIQQARNFPNFITHEELITTKLRWGKEFRVPVNVADVSKRTHFIDIPFTPYIN